MARLVKKFDLLLEPHDYVRLGELSKHFGLSMGAIIRLALKDLHQKMLGTSVNTTTETLLKSTKTAAPPPELDPFWQEFGK